MYMISTFLQTMSILIVNQSVIDMCAAFFSLPLNNDIFTATGLSRDSVYDQFVCRFWLTRRPFWSLLPTSTYGTVIMTLSRYIAVIYPIRYKIVRTSSSFHLFICPQCNCHWFPLLSNLFEPCQKASMCIKCWHWKLVALDTAVTGNHTVTLLSLIVCRYALHYAIAVSCHRAVVGDRRTTVYLSIFLHDMCPHRGIKISAPNFGGPSPQKNFGAENWKLQTVCCLLSNCKCNYRYQSFRDICSIFLFSKDAEELKKCNIFKQRQINIVPTQHTELVLEMFLFFRSGQLGTWAWQWRRRCRRGYYGLEVWGRCVPSTFWKFLGPEFFA